MDDREVDVQTEDADPSEGSARDMREERLHKVIARAGVASRRAAEQMILAGRVTVDGNTVRRLGTTVDAEQVVIHVDGARVMTSPHVVHLAINKPRGMVSTMADPEGRPCLGDLLDDRSARVFHVGRLDTDTEGLILATNDGELGHRLAHPSYGVPKTYLVEVEGPLARDVTRRLRAGVDLEDGVAAATRAVVLQQASNRAQLELTIHVGRNRVVRRMMEAVGHPVRRLVRVAVGPVSLGSLKPGRTRHLTRHEVTALYQLVDL